ncbi:MAG: LacI family DNA-binding transcriptional regulator [Lachnospiraceae bacterium]|nr:LacI family DNA-binding transcriptional regulator [Lachnospiraceae bacterium]
MKATIKDIAKSCGVSISTVSMALSEKPNRISKKTRELVHETAMKMNYQPNLAAVSLVNRKSKMIGIVVNDLRNTHIASLFMAINKVITPSGYSMICHVLNEENPSSNMKLIKLIESENISALIWAKSLEINHDQENKELCKSIESLGIPVMTMDDYRLDCAGAAICFDYELGGYLATNHLIKYGHIRIGCVTGEKDYKVTEQRTNGYKRALEEAGIPFEEGLVYEGNYTMESGYRALSYLMGQGVTAIFSFNDEMAFGLYQAARMYGIRVPEDLSIIGFDDVPFADVMEIPLSTIRVPIVEMGNYLGNEIIHILKNGGIGDRIKKIYKPDLLLRASTRKQQ